MNLKEIDLRKLYRTWKSDLGPFECFFRSTSFVSLKTYDDFILNDTKINEDYYKNIINEILENCNDDNFIIIDLPINNILDLSLILNNKYLIKPILNINVLFHPFGIVGCKDEINKLINNGLKLKKIYSSKFVMLIPYDRYNKNLESNHLSNRLNNQYGISEDDLPYVYMLKELGYKKIIIIVKDYIKEDLEEYLNNLNKDIEVEKIRVR